MIKHFRNIAFDRRGKLKSLNNMKRKGYQDSFNFQILDICDTLFYSKVYSVEKKCKYTYSI